MDCSYGPVLSAPPPRPEKKTRGVLFNIPHCPPGVGGRARTWVGERATERAAIGNGWLTSRLIIAAAIVETS